MPHLVGMTQSKWDSFTPAERERLRDLSGLSPQLIGLEGWRVMVITSYGETRRFIVGRSNGWRPCHIEMKTRRSFGGYPAEKDYVTVRKIEKVR